MADLTASLTRKPALVGIGLLLLSATSWVVATRVESPAQAAADASPPPRATLTAEVSNRPVTESIVVRGTVEAPDATEVAPVAANGGKGTGDLIVTGLPAEEGDTVQEGSPAIELSGRPVIVLSGSLPAWRDMRPGSQGPDVEQLQRALIRLGHLDIEEPDGLFGSSTEQAVAALYTELGYEPALTSTDARRQEAAAQRQVREAEAAVASAERALVSAKAGPSDSERAAARTAVEQAERELQSAQDDAIRVEETQSARVEAARSQYERTKSDPDSTEEEIDRARVQLVETQAEAERAIERASNRIHDAAGALEVARASWNDATSSPDVAAQTEALRAAEDRLASLRAEAARIAAEEGTMVPVGEITFVAHSPVRVAELNVALGDKPQDTVVTLTSEKLAVEAIVSPEERRSITVGAEATVSAEPDRIDLEATVESTGEEQVNTESGGRGFPVVLTTAEELPSELMKQDVQVEIELRTLRGTLVVPITAVSTGADGTTRVIRTDDGTDTVVEVEVELAAQGWVAVRTEELEVGDEVVVGR